MLISRLSNVRGGVDSVAEMILALRLTVLSQTLAAAQTAPESAESPKAERTGGVRARMNGD